MEDWLGNTITGGTETTRLAIDDFCQGFLAYETRAVNVLQAADAEPGHGLANTYAAMLHMFAEDPGAPENALPYLKRAEATASQLSERELATIALTRAWVDGDMAQVYRLGQDAARAFPRDLTLIKIAQYHEFNRGNAAGMLALAEHGRRAAPEIAYAHGMAAFGYEQCHLLDDAEAAAWKAVDLRRKEPWAHHALAHVMLTQGRIEEGRQFLADVADTWTDLNSFMITHNWWHQALFFISLGRFDDALSTYDSQVWGVWKDYSQDQIGAVSLLARLELAGVDVGDRWRDVASYLAARTHDFVNPFLTLQYLYGLARAGRNEAETLMENLRGHAASPGVDPVWSEVALPAAEGLMAHVKGDYEVAVKHLGMTTGRMLECGGSHAQRDLFEQILLDGVIRSGRDSLAQQMLEMRRGYEPNAIPTNRALAEVYERLGLSEEARKAANRATLHPQN